VRDTRSLDERIADRADEIAATWPAISDEEAEEIAAVFAAVAPAKATATPKRRLGRAA
jgi:hypothetical protein